MAVCTVVKSKGKIVVAFSEYMNFTMKPQVQFFLFVERYKVLLKLSLVLQHDLQFLERANLDKRLRDINQTCYVNKDFIVQVLVCTIKYEDERRPVVLGCAGCAMGYISVNPISTRGGQIMPT